MPPICPPPVSAAKKSTGPFSAAHAALGGRTLQTGQSRCFVGYKKHTLRLWLRHDPVGRRADVAGLRWPGRGTRVGRRRGTGAVRVRLGGEALPASICTSASRRRDIAGPTAAGASRWAQQVLRQVRPWIEPSQTFEKNPPGLGDVFFKSLRFTWTTALLADAAVSLRARALLGRPIPRHLLGGLIPSPLTRELETETPAPSFTQAKRESVKQPMKAIVHTSPFLTPSSSPIKSGARERT